MKKYILLILLTLNISSLKSVDLINTKVTASSINVEKRIPLRIENRSGTNVVWVILNRTGVGTRAYCIGDVYSKWDKLSRGNIRKDLRKDIGRIKINSFIEVKMSRAHNIKRIGVRYEGMGATATNYRKDYKVYVGLDKHAGRGIPRRTRQNIYKIGIEIYDNYIVTKQYVINKDEAGKAKGV